MNIKLWFVIIVVLLSESVYSWNLKILHQGGMSGNFLPVTLEATPKICEPSTNYSTCTGGVWCLSAWVEDFRAKYQDQNILTIQSGNFAHATTLSILQYRSFIYDIMDYLEFDIVVLGPRDFDYFNRTDTNDLVNLVSNRPYSVVGTNFDISKLPSLNNVILPYKILQYDGHNIAVLAVTEAVLTDSIGFFDDLTFTDSYKAILETMDYLLTEDIDIFILVVSHVNILSHAQTYLDRIPGLDLIILQFRDKTVYYFNGKTGKRLVPISSSGDYGISLILLDVNFTDSGVVDNVNNTTTFLSIPCGRSTPYSEQLKTTVQTAFTNLTESAKVEVLAKKTNSYVEDYSSTRMRTQETAMGNLVADAMRIRTGTQIALMNSGGVRAGVSGDITRYQVMSIVPFPSLVMTLVLDGRSLVYILQNSVAAVGTLLSNSGRFLCISGIRFTWSSANSTLENITIPGETVAIPQRIVSIWIDSPDGWKVIDLDAHYNVTTIDYLVRGGDFYGRSFSQNSTYVANRDPLDVTVIQYLKQVGTINPGLDGRIMKVTDQPKDWFRPEGLCESTHNCEQLCYATKNDYFCGCHAGYELDKDNKSCKPILLIVTLSVIIPSLVLGILVFILLKVNLKIATIRKLPQGVRWSFESAALDYWGFSWRKNTNSSFYFKTLDGTVDYVTVKKLLVDSLHGEKIPILSIVAVYNETLVNNFVGEYIIWNTRLTDNKKLFQKEDWRDKIADRDNFIELREWVIQKYQDRVKQFEWNNEALFPILPACHGTIFSKALKICNSGFVALNTLDAGYFGKGIYVTSYSNYSLNYAAGAEPAIIIAYILPGNPYPVVENHRGPESLLGTALKTGCQSHYVRTKKTGFVVTKPSEASYDEFVLGQENLVVPAFIVKVDLRAIHTNTFADEQYDERDSDEQKYIDPMERTE